MKTLLTILATATMVSVALTPASATINPYLGYLNQQNVYLEESGKTWLQGKLIEIKRGKYLDFLLEVEGEKDAIRVYRKSNDYNIKKVLETISPMIYEYVDNHNQNNIPFLVGAWGDYIKNLDGENIFRATDIILDDGNKDNIICYPIK